MPTPNEISRPCVECRKLTTRTTRCLACDTMRNQVRNQRRAHYRGDYRRRAAQVRANAVLCWICGKGARMGDPFTADHVEPGVTTSMLLPAHRSCNSRRGG